MRKCFCLLWLIHTRYFLFAYLTTTTIPSFTQIEQRLGINYAQTSWTISLPSLGLAIGPPLWSSLADIYGRRIVFIAGSVIALVSTIGIAVTTNFKGYMAGRFFQGVGVSPSAAIGMAIGERIFYDDQFQFLTTSSWRSFFRVWTRPKAWPLGNGNGLWIFTWSSK